MPSCRDTPGWPMSTWSTSSLTERSPARSASTRRRRVGSARIWKASGMGFILPERHMSCQQYMSAGSHYDGRMERVSVGSVVVDCNDFSTMVAFWREALGYVAKGLVEDDFVILEDPEGRRVNVSLQKVPERRVGKNRLHFDLYTSDQRGE